MQAEKHVAMEMTLIPHGQKTETRAARSTAGLQVLRAARLIAADAEAADTTAHELAEAQGDADEDSCDDDGEPATDAEVWLPLHKRRALRCLCDNTSGR